MISNTSIGVHVFPLGIVKVFFLWDVDRSRVSKWFCTFNYPNIIQTKKRFKRHWPEQYTEQFLVFPIQKFINNTYMYLKKNKKTINFLRKANFKWCTPIHYRNNSEPPNSVLVASGPQVGGSSVLSKYNEKSHFLIHIVHPCFVLHFLFYSGSATFKLDTYKQ